MAEFPLFCYGTLISSVVREKILGDQERLSIKPASLKGYAVMKVADAHYPALVKAAEDQVVLGVLVNGLSDIDMSILDKFEGINYSREARSILAEDGSCTESFVYFPNKTLETAGQWTFGDWEGSELNLFLSQDFDIAGIRPPEVEPRLK